MAQLTTAFFNTILKIEGGYQNRADDSGNYACGQLIGTNMGIAAPSLQTWWNRCPTVADMKGLTQAQARDFYAWYFDRWNLYPIENQQFFELLANNTMGSPAGAARVEQRSLNALGYPVAVDGNRGPATIAALNQAWRDNPTKIYNTVRAEWVKYLQSLNKPQFLAGWMYRMDKFFPPLGSGGNGSGLAWLAVAGAAVLYIAFKK